MESQIVVIVLVVVLVAVGAILWYTKYGGRKRTVVSALIDIYTTGRHHVELIPEEEVHPVDIVQLVISYTANVIMLTTSYESELTSGLYQLVSLNRKHYDLSNEVEYRQDLTNLVKAPLPSLLSSGKLSVGTSERYQVRLVRGKSMDYSISEFSIHGYKPNLANSVLYVYNAAVNRLDSPNLKLLHASLATLVAYFHDTKPTMRNNQAIAFAAVEYAFSILPGRSESSPGRISRKV